MLNIIARIAFHGAAAAAIYQRLRRLDDRTMPCIILPQSPQLSFSDDDDDGGDLVQTDRLTPSQSSRLQRQRLMSILN